MHIAKTVIPKLKRDKMQAYYKIIKKFSSIQSEQASTLSQIWTAVLSSTNLKHFWYISQSKDERVLSSYSSKSSSSYPSPPEDINPSSPELSTTSNREEAIWGVPPPPRYENTWMFDFRLFCVLSSIESITESRDSSRILLSNSFSFISRLYPFSVRK